MKKFALSTCALLAAALPAHAADLQVLSTGAVRQAVVEVASAYEKQTGTHVIVVGDTAGGVAKRVAAGQTCDVALSTPTALQKLVEQGGIRAGSVRELGTVGIGIAVRAGAARPDISSEAAFKTAMLQAASITYIDPASGGSSGIYTEGLLKRLGIYDQVAAKVVKVNGGLVADKLLDGSAALAVQQLSELRGIKGVDVVGPLPAPLQNLTHYADAVCSATQNQAAATAFVAQLHGEAGRAALSAHGVDPAP